ncbi:hypothetical protein FRC08_004264 [Ceratobasidium sp. 394]|nr:hypothetical protein FRC08_004264 [Ceratobasidium sp. 394]
MVQWGGFEDERNQEIQLHKARHAAYWEEHGNPELELWRFETGFAHGWGAGNNEEHGELAEQRLAEHVAEVSNRDMFACGTLLIHVCSFVNSMEEMVMVATHGNMSMAIGYVFEI